MCLGAKALTTTKYHAEYAGEGIEYLWGAAKAIYRRYPLTSKRGKTNFDLLVAKCISREVLTTEMVQKFSHQARSYMLTYKILEVTKHQSESGSEMKSHGAALDFDKDFIMKSITATDFNFNKEVERDNVRKGSAVEQKCIL